MEVSEASLVCTALIFGNSPTKDCGPCSSNYIAINGPYDACVTRCRCIRAGALIHCRTSKHLRVVSTDSYQAHPMASNHLNREYHSSTPDTSWSCDITYIHSDRRFMYHIIGRQNEESAIADLVVHVLKKALIRKGNC